MSFATRFKYVEIENAYLFGGVHHVDLDKQGLVSVVGENRDARPGDGDVTASNGSGKSTLLKCFVRAWFGAKKACDRELKSACLYGGPAGTRFRIESEVVRNSHTYRVVEAYKHPDYPNGVSFYIDGKQVGSKNSEESYRPTFLKAALGLTYEEFISTVVIPQNSAHVLINGTPQACIEFISKMFGLGRYDDLYEHFKTRYDNTSEALQALVPVKAERDTYKQQLADLPPKSEIVESFDALSLDVSKLRARRKKLREQRDTLKGAAAAAATQRKAAKAMAAIRDNNPTLNFDTPKRARREAIDKRDQLAKSIIDLKHTLELARDNEEALAAIASAKAVIDDLGMDATIPIDVMRTKLQKMSTWERQSTLDLEKIVALTRVREKGQAIRIQMKQLNAENIPYKRAKALYEQYAELEAGETAIVEQCVTLLDIREDYDTELTHCPTCGTKVTAATMKVEIDKLKARMFKHEELRKEHHAKAMRYLIVIDYNEYTKEYPDMNLDITDEQIRAIAQKIKDTRDKIKIIERVVVACEEIESNKKVLKISASLDVDDVRSKLDRRTRLHAKWSEAVDVYNEYIGLQAGSAQSEVVTNADDLEYIESKLEKVELALEQALIDLEHIEATFDNYKNLRKRLRAAEDRLSELPGLEKQERTLKALCAAYGKSGLKLEKVSSIIKAIRDKLPTWLRRTITEPNFRIDVKSDPTALTLECVKTIKRKVKTGKRIGAKETVEVRYPVRSASGGEKTRIMFALLMTLLDLIPESKRTNLVMLDELEGGLDPASRYLLPEFFIPELRNVKDTVMFISHSLEIPRTLIDSTIQVTRKNNTATITQGAF